MIVLCDLKCEKKSCAFFHTIFGWRDVLACYRRRRYLPLPMRTYIDMQDFSQLSSKMVTEVLMLEIKMAPAAKAYLISGFPRSMRDVVEYSDKVIWHIHDEWINEWVNERIRMKAKNNSKNFIV